jgi:hypothetical protein
MSHPEVLPFVATLRRLAADAASTAAARRCEICAAPIPGEHRHLVDVITRRVLCACQTCRPADGRYRAVPQRYARLPAGTFSVAQWDALAIPVGLAFFFFNSQLARIVACYPGAAGAAESVLPLEAWSALADGNAWIDTLVPDVEAVLVRRVADEYQACIVPIDACYELAGRIREMWTGFRGGDAAQLAIDTFFAAVAEKSRACQAPAGHWPGAVEERT